MKKLTIGILGGRGMLGSDLVKFLGEHHQTTAIDKDNYSEFQGQEFDVLVNANGNSRRFWANQNILEDFEASTTSVYKSLFDFKFGKYIYISSSDVYPNHSHLDHTREDIFIDPKILSPYGLHKYLSEIIVSNHTQDFLILRCSMMLGQNLKKGPVHDILQNQPLFVTEDSRLQMITTKGVAEVIEELLRRPVKKEVFNVGGRGTVDFQSISQYFGKNISFAKEAKCQIYEMPTLKLASLIPPYPLKTSDEYLREFLSTHLG
ncbi:MAG: NAD-dependent epimerase/dehydratase family protein [Candidatus Liptonbacteria bacterium]|nr:NAD-dependent epimerase/dehydratase family protein [Candidatus Liptonbacteria bacterium]